MRAATIRDQEIVIEQHPDPEPLGEEVLVRVRAAGLNGGDMMQKRGLYPAPPGCPEDIPGMELAGEVAALGPRAQRFEQGARVMAIVGGGAQAELCLVHERQLMPVPDALDWTSAGGLPEVFATAHDAIFTQGELRTGEHLQMSCHCSMPDDLPMGAVHRIITQMEAAFLREQPEVGRLLIHPEPVTDNDR